MTGPMSEIKNAAPPSSWRLPVTILLLLAAPPLALVSWILLSGGERPGYLRSAWIRWGFGIIVVGALPLLAVILAAALGLTSDPNPNPVGLGLLFFAAGVIGFILLFVGILVHARRRSA
jgi:hypothetical protein